MFVRDFFTHIHIDGMLFVIAEDYRLTDCKTSTRSDSTSDDEDVGTNDKRSELASNENQGAKEDDFSFIDLSYYKR